MSTVLTVQDVFKGFGNRRVLQGVSFALGDRDRIGMIGANGSGKSTLLKMVARGANLSESEASLLEPDAGSITWKRDLVLEYVAQEPRLEPLRTVGEVLARPGVPDHEMHTVSAALQLPPHTQPMGTTSIGERRRVALGRALLGKPDVLLLDEPTNHLDVRTVEWLEARLAAWSGALLCVTHDRSFLDKVATRILEVDRGHLHAYEGDYTEFLVKQAERHSIEGEHERIRHAFVRREIDWIRRSPAARSVKQKARIDRFDAAVAARPVGDEVLAPELKLKLPHGPRLGGTIVELEKVAQAVGEPPRTLFRDLTLVMKPGDRIGIVGKNGAGKTTLIRTILGELAPSAGKVVVGQNTRPAYLEQSRADLVDTNTVIDEVSDGYDHVELPPPLNKTHVRTFLRMMGFPETVVDSKVGQLSGGERNRVQLAKLLRRGGNLLVLDEPTNDLDLVTLGALEDALIEFPGCALIVSHDRWFLDRVATGILAFDDGGVTFYEGSYTSYLAKRPASAAVAERQRVKSDSRAPQAPKQKKLSFKDAAELAGMEATIEAADARVKELEAQLFDPDVVRTRGNELPFLTAALESARDAVDTLYARWAELEALAPKA